MVARNVDAHVAQLDPPVRELVEALRKVVREAAPEAKESLKWGTPCYERNGLLCSIHSARGYARLQFFRGASLADPAGLLEGAGKGMRHVKVRSADSIPSVALRALVREAVRLNTPG